MDLLIQTVGNGWGFCLWLFWCVFCLLILFTVLLLLLFAIFFLIFEEKRDTAIIRMLLCKKSRNRLNCYWYCFLFLGKGPSLPLRGNDIFKIPLPEPASPFLIIIKAADWCCCSVMKVEFLPVPNMWLWSRQLSQALTESSSPATCSVGVHCPTLTAGSTSAGILITLFLCAPLFPCLLTVTKICWKLEYLDPTAVSWNKYYRFSTACKPTVSSICVPDAMYTVRKVKTLSFIRDYAQVAPLISFFFITLRSWKDHFSKLHSPILIKTNYWAGIFSSYHSVMAEWKRYIAPAYLTISTFAGIEHYIFFVGKKYFSRMESVRV